MAASSERSRRAVPAPARHNHHRNAPRRCRSSSRKARAGRGMTFKMASSSGSGDWIGHLCVSDAPGHRRRVSRPSQAPAAGDGLVLPVTSAVQPTSVQRCAPRVTTTSSSAHNQPHSQSADRGRRRRFGCEAATVRHRLMWAGGGRRQPLDDVPRKPSRRATQRGVSAVPRAAPRRCGTAAAHDQRKLAYRLPCGPWRESQAVAQPTAAVVHVVSSAGPDCL
jgi:hypothetical protein